MWLPADGGIRNISQASLSHLRVKPEPPSLGGKEKIPLFKEAACFPASSEDIIGNVNLPQRKEERSAKNPRRVSEKLHN